MRNCCLLSVTGALSAAERSYPTSEVRSRECQAATAQEQLRGETLRSRPEAVATKNNPMSKEQWLPERRRA